MKQLICLIRAEDQDTFRQLEQPFRSLEAKKSRKVQSRALKNDDIPAQRCAKNTERNLQSDIFISSHISEIFAWTDPDLLTTRKL